MKEAYELEKEQLIKMIYLLQPEFQDAGFYNYLTKMDYLALVSRYETVKRKLIDEGRIVRAILTYAYMMEDGLHYLCCNCHVFLDADIVLDIQAPAFFEYDLLPVSVNMFGENRRIVETTNPNILGIAAA